MIDKKKISRMIKLRKWHADCGGDAQEEWWDELPDMLSKDIEETKEFLRNCTDDELYWISELFGDICYNFQNKEFVDFIKELQKQHPSIDLKSEIEDAENAILN